MELGPNYDGPLVHTADQGASAYMPVLPVPPAVPDQPPRPPVPYRRDRGTTASREATDARIEAAVDDLLVTKRRSGSAVYVNGSEMHHEASPSNDQRLWGVICNKVSDPSVGLSDLSQTELRILRGRVALARARGQQAGGTAQLQQQQQPAATPPRRAPPAPRRPKRSPHSQQLLKDPDVASAEKLRDAAVQGALRDIDRITKQKDGLATQVQALEAERDTARDDLESLERRCQELGGRNLHSREREACAANVARLTSQVERLKSRLESPGLGQLTESGRRLHHGQPPPAEPQQLHSIEQAVKEGAWKGQLYQLLDLDRDGHVSVQDLKEALSCLTSQAWTTRHASNMLLAAGCADGSGASYAELECEPFYEVFEHVVQTHATLPQAKAKQKAISAEEDRVKAEQRQLDDAIRAVQQQVAMLGRSLPTYMQRSVAPGDPVAATALHRSQSGSTPPGSSGALPSSAAKAQPRSRPGLACSELSDAVVSREALLSELSGLQRRRRAAVFRPPTFLTPQEECMLRSYRCGKRHSAYNRATDEMLHRHGVPLAAQVTLNRLHRKAQQQAHRSGTASPDVSGCAQSQQGHAGAGGGPSPVGAGVDGSELGPSRPPAKLQLFSMEHPEIQGVYSFEPTCAGLRWAGPSGAVLEFDDSGGRWVVRCGGDAVMHAAQPGEHAVQEVQWQGAPETAFVGVSRSKKRHRGDVDPWHVIYSKHPISSSAFRSCPTASMRNTDSLRNALTAAHRISAKDDDLRTYKPPSEPFT